MRAFRSGQVVVSALFLLVLQLAMPIAVGAQTAAVEIPAGTRVMLTFPATMSSSTLYVGQQVTLQVQGDVTVNGVVVIKSGANAMGEVTTAEKPGIVGAPGSLNISVRTVEAVDGSSVPISGSLSLTGTSKQTTSILVTILCCVLGLLVKGEDARVLQGTTLDSSVSVATKVQA